jgi:hypothetical protein
MKQRVIAFILSLLLLTLPFVTNVFAEPDDEPETTAEPVETLAPETVPTTEAPAPVETETVELPPETQPEAPTEPEVSTEPEPVEPEPEPETEPPTEPTEETEPEPEPENVNIYQLEIRLTLDEASKKQDFLFTIQSDEVFLEVVIPAGETSLTVYGLPYGHYQITEERGWSWTFDADAKEEDLTKTSWLWGNQIQNWVTFHPVAGESNWLGCSARGDGT